MSEQTGSERLGSRPDRHYSDRPAASMACPRSMKVHTSTLFPSRVLSVMRVAGNTEFWRASQISNH